MPGMTTAQKTRQVNEALAHEFVHRHGRVLDRRRLLLHCGGDSPDGVVAAVLAYQNADGGFGQALEPDCRTPFSQPEATRTALAVLDDAGRLDAVDLARVADWLASVTAADGGVPFCLPTVAGFPRAPWWEPEGDPAPGNLTPTGGLVGLLRKAGVQHSWLDRAEQFCWLTLENRTEPLNQYAASNAATFLFNQPDTDRAEHARKQLLAELNVEREGPDAFTPLHFAPHPNHPCRAAFDDATIDTALDRLVAEQQEDGGWPVTWPSPGETAIYEWRAAHHRGVARAEGVRAPSVKVQ
jgi:hypothetical protein